MVEPPTGIEPAQPAWKAGVLPLNYGGMVPGANGKAPGVPVFSGRQHVVGQKGGKERGGDESPRGAGGGSRTPDPLLTKQPLWPLSYTSMLPVFPGCQTIVRSGRSIYPVPAWG